jgi:hypothetical protein
MTRREAARLYLAAVAPLDKTTAAYDAVVRSGPSPAAAAPAADRVASALAHSDVLLLKLAQVYPHAATDLRALVGDDARSEGDLRSLVAQTAATLPAWTQQFATDNARAATAAEAVRTDLGLSPAS